MGLSGWRSTRASMEQSWVVVGIDAGDHQQALIIKHVNRLVCRILKSEAR